MSIRNFINNTQFILVISFVEFMNFGAYYYEFGALFERGVGGHGTVSSKEKTQLRLRKRAEIGARIRAVAGCRWPPEMLERARSLNEELLSRRPGADEARREAEQKCARFRKHPCLGPVSVER